MGKKTRSGIAGRNMVVQGPEIGIHHFNGSADRSNPTTECSRILELCNTEGKSDDVAKIHAN